MCRRPSLRDAASLVGTWCRHHCLCFTCTLSAVQVALSWSPWQPLLQALKVVGLAASSKPHKAEAKQLTWYDRPPPLDARPKPANPNMGPVAAGSEGGVTGKLKGSCPGAVSLLREDGVRGSCLQAEVQQLETLAQSKSFEKAKEVG